MAHFPEPQTPSVLRPCQGVSVAFPRFNNGWLDDLQALPWVELEALQQQFCDFIRPITPCWLGHHFKAYHPADVRVRRAENHTC